MDRENRKKFKEKSKQCTFVGYGVDSFGYCLWDYDENKKIIRRIDVVFNDKFMYKY